jgi:hypothetical protein
MVKFRYFLILIIFFLAVFSCYSDVNDPPFGKELKLRISNTELILGFTNLDQVEKKLGKPEKAEFEKHGGEEFYWENIETYHYFNDTLSLIFSIGNGRLIQIVFKPKQSDKYEVFWGVSNISTRSEIEKEISRKGLAIDKSGNITWFTFYESRKPIFIVSCALKFTENGNLATLNYMVDAPWKE